jgi:uncharacterized repeat protein (TIGR03943 family)
VNREAQSVVLFVLGVAVLRISIDGSYLRYVKEWLQPLLIASGAGLVILALVAAWADGLLRRLPEQRAAPVSSGDGTAAPAGDSPDADAEGHADAHEHAGPRVAWLLLLPVLAIFLIAPPALGSYAASRDAGTVAQPADDAGLPPLPPGDPVTMSLSDYSVRAIWDEGRTLQGRMIKMSGFVTPREDGGWHLTRMALNCCAADARAVKVEIRGGPDLPPDTWVEVVGQWSPTAKDVDVLDAIPALVPSDVRKIEQPREPYET